MYEIHTPPILKQLIQEILPKMLVETTKTLVKIVCNGLDNMISSQNAIAYKCPIPDNLRDYIGLKKRFINNPMIT